MAGLLDYPEGAAFGTGSPAEMAQQPSGLGALLSGAYNAMGLLAKRAIGASEMMRTQGMYDPAPMVEAAMLPMGTGAMAGVPMRAGEAVLGSGIVRPAMPASLFDKVAEKYPGVKLDGSVDKSGYATLSRIEVPNDLRNQGLGTRVMEDLIREADSQGVPMALSPSSDFGGNKARLAEFYQRFGFVPNKGRNKDFATRETMIRPLPDK